MLEYLRSNTGFSWIGLVFLLMLFIPNILWARDAPPEFRHLSAAEPTSLVVFERVGQILACVTLLYTKSLQPRGFSAQSVLLVAALVLMILYELFWVRYFTGPRTAETFYRPFGGIPLPGAILPVAAMVCLGFYAGSPWIVVAAIILGIGHIGIHALHAVSLRVWP